MRREQSRETGALLCTCSPSVVESGCAECRARSERAREAGRRGGRPRRSFDVEQARLLHARGVSLRRLALMLDVPRSTLARALRR